MRGGGDVSHVSSSQRGKVNTPALHIVVQLDNTQHHKRARQTNAVKTQQLNRDETDGFRQLSL